MLRPLSLVLAILAGAAEAQDSPNTVAFPPRPATTQDATLLASERFAPVKQELGRIGLHRELGRACTVFVTADSVRPIETPLPLAGSTVTLPYASFLIWSADRPYADSVLYHVFGATEAAYTQPQKLVAGTANQAYTVVLGKREPYPSAAEVERTHDVLAAGPFLETGVREGARAATVRPYILPTEKDDAGSVLPRKAERTLQITCLSDPDRVTNCLCVGTKWRSVNAAPSMPT